VVFLYKWPLTLNENWRRMTNDAYNNLKSVTGTYNDIIGSYWFKVKLLPFDLFYSHKIYAYLPDIFNEPSMKLPLTVAARSKTCTVFARSEVGIVGLNPTRRMDICVRLFCVCAVLCAGSGLATSWSPVQGVLPTVCRFENLKKGLRSNKRTVEP
jgi:hypothetical protein